MDTYSLTILTRVGSSGVQSSLLPASAELGDNQDGSLQVRRIRGIPMNTRQLVVLRLWNLKRGEFDLNRLEFDFSELGHYIEAETVPLVKLQKDLRREYVPV
jgi:hypothetical protein